MLPRVICCPWSWIRCRSLCQCRYWWYLGWGCSVTPTWFFLSLDGRPTMECEYRRPVFISLPGIWWRECWLSVVDGLELWPRESIKCSMVFELSCGDRVFWGCPVSPVCSHESFTGSHTCCCSSVAPNSCFGLTCTLFIIFTVTSLTNTPKTWQQLPL